MIAAASASSRDIPIPAVVARSRSDAVSEERSRSRGASKRPRSFAEVRSSVLSRTSPHSGPDQSQQPCRWPRRPHGAPVRHLLQGRCRHERRHQLEGDHRNYRPIFDGSEHRYRLWCRRGKCHWRPRQRPDQRQPGENVFTGNDGAERSSSPITAEIFLTGQSRGPPCRGYAARPDHGLQPFAGRQDRPDVVP